ncbi:hypothetical protein [Liquorilactobacillus nagelii]|uniref:hypothetical protein n=1 Tax=Liquorilactobacillus nagelii TaxID=82688 RepID=UPI0039EA5BF0
MNVSHIRIEIDDIGKVPVVYIDGKRADYLIRVHVDWNTIDEYGSKINLYNIETLDEHGAQQGYGQRVYSKL